MKIPHLLLLLFAASATGGPLVTMPPPHINSINVNGLKLTIQAANGTVSGQYVLLGTTNLALNLWTTILTVTNGA
jgi:hypothetical protein